MQLKVYECGQEVGWCSVKDDGLYWRLECDCIQKSNELMGLFGAGHYLGLPEKNINRCYLRRRIAKKSAPDLSQCEKIFLLPRKQKTISVFGRNLIGHIERVEERTILRIPCSKTEAHPCMPLFCFLKYENGFWLFDLDEDQDRRR